MTHSFPTLRSYDLCPPHRCDPLLWPDAARTAPKPCTLYPRRIRLRCNRERLVIVGTCKFERFHGALRPGKNTVFQHTSILVRPQVKECFHTPYGGAAGYRPRVRCVYFTASFIAISGLPRQKGI